MGHDTVMSDRVEITREGAIAQVRLNRPDKHNGMDMPMLNAVIAAGESLAADRDLRAVILSGHGPSFCAGLDVASVMGNKRAAASLLLELYKPWANLVQRWGLVWRSLPVPVIAAVHGNCFGAGAQLALAADIRFARPDCRFSIMEAKWGLVPDMSGAATLRELLPLDVAMELTMTGRVLSGDQAKAYGLVSHLADDPMAAAVALANEIATRSPDSVAAAKGLLHAAWGRDEAAVLAAERKFQRQLLGRQNQRIAAKRNAEIAASEEGLPATPFGPRRVG